MGVFRPIVQPALLLMLHQWHDVCLGCCVAAQLVGDDSTWDVLKAFQQFAKELLGGFLVPPRLHEDIKHLAILVDCTPEILQLAVDREKDFIEMPSVAEMMTFRTHPLGIRPTELLRLLADRFVTDGDPALGHHFCHVPITERESKIKPSAMRGESGTSCTIAVGWSACSFGH
jgi:hypothetical protein